MILPSTEWCGMGGAKNPGQLGGNFMTDNCCRKHDLNCRHYIESWRTKYGLTNKSLGTISHCSCDER